MGARFWIELLSAFGFGVLMSVIPVFNPEAFMAAGQATGLLGPLTLGIGLGVGQGVGKAILFQLVRHGRRLPWLNRLRTRSAKPPPQPGTWRQRWRGFVQHAMKLVEHRWWGPVVSFSAGALSIPPNYVTTLLAATTKVNFYAFSIAITAGFTVRNTVEALILAGVLDRWFR